MSVQKQKRRGATRQRAKQRQQRKRRDTVKGMPFRLAFMGDPARAFRCQDYRSYNLTPRHKQGDHPFHLLAQYAHHRVAEALQANILYVQKAP